MSVQSDVYIFFCVCFNHAVCVSCSLRSMRMIPSIELLLLRSVKEEKFRNSFYWPLEDRLVIAGEDDCGSAICCIKININQHLLPLLLLSEVRLHSDERQRLQTHFFFI